LSLGETGRLIEGLFDQILCFHGPNASSIAGHSDCDVAVLRLNGPPSLTSAASMPGRRKTVRLQVV
jgi:hypothetical protein